MFKKETHVESFGNGISIITSQNCPLSEKIAKRMGIIIEINKGEEIPCCFCNSYLSKGLVILRCPGYYGLTKYEETEETKFDCRIDLISI